MELPVLPEPTHLTCNSNEFLGKKKKNTTKKKKKEVFKERKKMYIVTYLLQA